MEYLENTLQVKIPECIKVILHGCGYSNLLSLEFIDDEKISIIEWFVNKKLNNTIKTLECCHSELYKIDTQRGEFHFVPGHRDLIKNLSKEISKKALAERQHSNFWEQLDEIATQANRDPALSNVMKELIQTAIENFGKTANLNRYSETIQYLSVYIYMLCGRQSYEILSKNLPIPAVSTVCELL